MIIGIMAVPLMHPGTIGMNIGRGYRIRLLKGLIGRHDERHILRDVPEALPGLDRSYINPKYTTVLGLLKSEAKKIATSSSSSGRSEREKSSLGGRLKGFFGKLF